MIALVDTDIIVYRTGFAAEHKVYAIIVDMPNGEKVEKDFRYAKDLKAYRASLPAEAQVELEIKTHVDPVEFAYQNVNTTLANLSYKLKCPMELYLTGKGNYRNDLAKIKPYKGSRSPFAKPKHYDAIREFLVEHHKAVIVQGWEADDEVGIRSCELGDEGIIVSNDKDLDMIPGKHYNWVKDAWYELDDREAIKNFYLQILTGDDTDNIPGLPGVGPATAAKLLEGCTRPASLWGSVYRAYFNHYGHRYDDDHTITEALLEIARLLWIKRSRDEGLWEYPTQ